MLANSEKKSLAEESPAVPASAVGSKFPDLSSLQHQSNFSAILASTSSDSKLNDIAAQLFDQICVFLDESSRKPSTAVSILSTLVTTPLLVDEAFLLLKRQLSPVAPGQFFGWMLMALLSKFFVPTPALSTLLSADILEVSHELESMHADDTEGKHEEHHDSFRAYQILIHETFRHLHETRQNITEVPSKRACRDFLKSLGQFDVPTEESPVVAEVEPEEKESVEVEPEEKESVESAPVAEPVVESTTVESTGAEPVSSIESAVESTEASGAH
jgi:hypothetical protein